MTVMLFAGTIEGAVTRLEVVDRKPAFGGGAFGSVGTYEAIRGRALGALNPTDPHNRVIVDIATAPRNASGLVEYATDVLILRPTDSSKGNGRIVFEFNNRGNIRALELLNDAVGTNDLTTAAAAGNGFLMREGYTVVECGWDATVDPGDGRLTIQVPTAKGPNGTTLEGPALEEFVIDTPDVVTRRLTYRAALTDSASAQMTVRTFYGDEPQVVPASEWELRDDRTIGLLPRGRAFTAGRLYELTYRAADPLVAGVGFAAVRDLASYLRDRRDGPRVERIYTAGVSQPIRFAHDLVALGFNEDEHGRQVFDGMLNWVGGASGGFFNCRFAQPGRTHRQRIGRWYPEFAFPFANQALRDRVTGQVAGRMDRCRATNTCPRVLEVNSEAEYWTKGMSLLHTDTEGHDLPDEPNSRNYLLANLPHSPIKTTNLCQQPPNPLAPGPTLRALLTALDAWVSRGTTPPPSRVPTVRDGTLVKPTSQQTVGFPSIPGVVYNGRLHTGDLFDFGPNWQAGLLAQLPPKLLGMPYPVLVPRTDADGRDLAGVRQVEVAVPTASYTGWGLRRGPAAGDGCDHIGQRLPFAATIAARQQSGDPRLSLEERYPNSSAYLEQVRAATKRLVEERFLLPEDAARYIADAERSGAPR